MRLLTRWVLLLLVLLLLGLGLLYRASPPPTPDAFYAAPVTIPAAPGRLLRHEPFTRVVPSGATVWRILYTTMRADGQSAVASAIVLASAAPARAPRRVVAWNHGTTGVAPGCAPSVLPAPFPFDRTVPGVQALIDEGWVMVATDYVGLGTAGPHPYLIGEAEGRSALDAVRAARQLPGLSLADQTVVWGHSQGGHAALWTAILASGYAPDAQVIGVAAAAPATMLPALVDAAKDSTVGAIMAAYVVEAYSAVYADVRFDEYIGPRRRARGMAARCLSGPGSIVSVLTSLSLETPIFRQAPTQGGLAMRLDQNVPRGPIEVPVFLAQGTLDDLVLPATQDAYVAERCAAGQAIDYRRYADRDHVGIVAADSPFVDDLVAWTRARFAGERGTARCSTTSR